MTILGGASLASAGTVDKPPRIVSHSMEVAEGFRLTARLRLCDDSGGNIRFLVSETRFRDGQRTAREPSFTLVRTGTRSCRSYVLTWKAKLQPFRYGDYYLVAIGAVDKGGLNSKAVTEYWAILD